jgi:modulator of FtsH protease HflK
MNILTGWFRRPPILMTEQPRGPWGGGGDGNGGNGAGGGSGPRNPWSVPPKGAKPTALDDFLKKARNGGGGGPFGGGRGPHLPGAGSRSLWTAGAAILVGLWLVFTSFHSIGPQERGVVSYFGRYGGTLDPGIRMTLPAPIASVDTIDVQNFRTENFPENAGENLVLTKDQNIIDLAYSVRWNVSNPENYAFQIADVPATVRATAEASMREAIANVTLDEAITTGRARIQNEVQDRMQRILNDYKAGVRIQGVAIKQAGPPSTVNDAFKDVSAAQQDASAAMNQAQTYAQRKLAQAQGEAAAFNAYYEQYRLAPEVTRRRMYYETMEQVLRRTDKTIVETPGGVVPYLPLDRQRSTPEPPAPVPQAGGRAGQ